MEITPPSPDAASHRVEIFATVLLGIATILMALVSFRVALLDDQVTENFHAALTTNGGANDRFSEFDTAFTLENSLFIAWVAAPDDDIGTRERLYDTMDDGLREALDAWLPVRDEYATPFDFDTSTLISTGLLSEAQNLLIEAKVSEEAARDADQKGDLVGLSQILFAVTLFSAGLSVIVRTKLAQTVFLLSASVGLSSGVLIYAIGESM